jgi:hypothetical protein
MTCPRYVLLMYVLYSVQERTISRLVDKVIISRDEFQGMILKMGGSEVLSMAGLYIYIYIFIFSTVYTLKYCTNCCSGRHQAVTKVKLGSSQDTVCLPHE